MTRNRCVYLHSLLVGGLWRSIIRMLGEYGVCGYENDYLRILIGELNIYTVTTIQEYF